MVPASLTDFFTMSSCAEGSCLSRGAFELVLKQDTVGWGHLLSVCLEPGLSPMSMSCKAGRLLCMDSGDRACLSQSAEASQNVGNLYAAVSAAGHVRRNLAMVLSWEE